MAWITDHGRRRGKERIGLGARAVARRSQIALAEGQAPAAFVGAFRRYLDGVARKDAATIRVHGEHVFIFSMADGEFALRTVWLVPGRFRRLLRRLREE